MTNHLRVTSPLRWLLRCTVSNGVFSHERLVRFTDAFGSTQTALVHAGLVHTHDDGSWIEVAAALTDGDRTLVAMPSDGRRIWAPSGSLTIGA